ncbi:Glucan endo-1,3-beta-glucosidase 7 [Vitis vinifera]|uniref:glucan endo-1,3-beta-D-glucosidase n=1 Tax=Vitis vinifera TaxID=29760 RepID=A0A438C0Y0_VITVI|nr:Glucan endo-1,3-beta-glucosidase 7 [Vitis vinifera]
MPTLSHASIVFFFFSLLFPSLRFAIGFQWSGGTRVHEWVFGYVMGEKLEQRGQDSQSFIGINYGQVANNLPPPEATAKLLKSTSIEKVRLYGADPGIIKALANTGIGIVIGAANGDIPALASDPNFAAQWVNSNVIAYYPASKIILITVGNEVMSSTDQNLMSQLLPAMQNVQNALNAASLGGKIKVSTVHSMAVLTQSDPPSSGAFNPATSDTMRGLLEFQRNTGSPFAINPYPFFAYQSDPRPRHSPFACFNPTRDELTRATISSTRTCLMPRYVSCNFYSKLLSLSVYVAKLKMMDPKHGHVKVDAVRSALNAMGFKEVEIVVAETGWPYSGDANEVGPSIENAKAYNGNLIAHLRSMAGTPLMPGKSVDTYIFALYDENLKPGPGSERAFGLFKPDLSMTYDVSLSKSSQTPSTPETPVNPSPNPTASSVWCVPKTGVSDAQLQANLDYACSQGIDCTPIQPGGACFEPNTVASHAAYAMNLLYQSSGKNSWNCDFTQTATLTSSNPSKFSSTSPLTNFE